MKGIVFNPLEQLVVNEPGMNRGDRRCYREVAFRL